MTINKNVLNIFKQISQLLSYISYYLPKNQAAKVKHCEVIGEWTEAIRNHFWFVCQNCNGDEEKLKVYHDCTLVEIPWSLFMLMFHMFLSANTISGNCIYFYMYYYAMIIFQLSFSFFRIVGLGSCITLLENMSG